MLPETSAFFVDVVEHPTRVPTTITAKKGKHNLSVFMFLLCYDIGHCLISAREGPNAAGRSIYPPNVQTNGHSTLRTPCQPRPGGSPKRRDHSPYIRAHCSRDVKSPTKRDSVVPTAKSATAPSVFRIASAADYSKSTPSPRSQSPPPAFK